MRAHTRHTRAAWLNSAHATLDWPMAITSEQAFCLQHAKRDVDGLAPWLFSPKGW